MKYHIEFDLDFKSNPYKGLYIALEGIDGSGKSSQVTALVSYFQKQGKKVVKTREPRKKEGLIGELIQKILHGKVDVPPVALQYLFSADRRMHYEEVVIPALKQGAVVVSDRCFWSAVPYGILDQEDFGNIKNSANILLASQSILSLYHQFIVPDYTFYLDISVDEAWNRLRNKEEKREIYEDKAKIAKVVPGYEWLIREFPKEFTVVDGGKPKEEVTQQILRKLPKLLK